MKSKIDFNEFSLVFLYLFGAMHKFRNVGNRLVGTLNRDLLNMNKNYKKVWNEGQKLQILRTFVKKTTN